MNKEEKTEQKSVAQIELRNPFPGLRPFTIKESHLFFGREGQSDEVLVKLSQNRFVGIIGPSGSGKSSFVYCGILPILYGGFLTDISSNWEVIVTKPGEEPINNLAGALLKSSEKYNNLDQGEIKVRQTIISALLHSRSLGLVESIQQLDKPKNINYLILIDQFEEVFWHTNKTQDRFNNETLAFVNLLIEAINYEDLPIYVAITMRSDFIGDCSQFSNLTQKLNNSHYLIPQMTREQKKKAIEGPLAVNGVQVSSRLMQRLINDLGNNPDQLPILQHALMRTWDHWVKHKEFEKTSVIDLKHYEIIGGMSEALSLHADETYNKLDEKQKNICEITFKSITEKRGESSGVRKPKYLKDIVALTEASEEEVIEVIDKFRRRGVSLLTPTYGITIHPNSMIDVAHESLMRIWIRLKNWVDDEAEAAQMYLRLTEAAQMHQNGKGNLWRPPDLQIALNWLNQHKPTLAWGQRYHPAYERTMAFLDYSLKEFRTEQKAKEVEQKRKLARAKITAIIFGSLMIVALLFLVYAIYQQTEAKKQETLAKANALEAKQQRDQARLATEEAKQERDNAEKAKKIAEKQKKVAELKTREAERLQKIASSQREIALINEKSAKKNAIQAEKNLEIANKERKIAEQKEREAKRARYIAQSKAMALKSQELTNNPELQALLAQQSYNFNVENNGYEYDKDVYDGLFYALKNYQHPITVSIKSHKKGAARALASTPNDKYLYSGGSDGSIMKWRKRGKIWKNNEIIAGQTNHVILTVAIDKNEKYLATGGLFTLDRNNNYIEIYNLKNLKKEPKKITGYKSNVQNIIFTPDGQGLYAWGNSGYSIYLYQFNWEKSIARQIISPNVKISSIALSPDGKKLAASGNDGTIYMWDASNKYAMDKIKVTQKNLTAITFSPKDQRILVGDVEGVIYIIENKAVIRELSGHTSIIESIQFNHRGTSFASSSKDSRVRLWNYNNLRKQPITLENQDWAWDVIFSPDDKDIIVAINSTRENLENIDYPIRIWPTSPKLLSNILCGLITQNMTQDEWDIFAGQDLAYESTCINLSPNNVQKDAN